MFRQLLERWNNWIGDRDMELAIRAQVKADGYSTRNSKITNFRVAAMERPGWVSIFEFRVELKDDPDNPMTLYGVARDDSRSKTKVHLYEDLNLRDQQRVAWSEGMILAPYLRR